MVGPLPPEHPGREMGPSLPHLSAQANPSYDLGLACTDRSCLGVKLKAGGRGVRGDRLPVAVVSTPVSSWAGVAEGCKGPAELRGVFCASALPPNPTPFWAKLGGGQRSGTTQVSAKKESTLPATRPARLISNLWAEGGLEPHSDHPARREHQ